ncbi:Ribosome maturation protein SBDS [Carpediemonas membranifera]|uniref:Ribosome maturation protein SBDS n=1 Tax=Carpediemonas membranifera TaxID=201153 RepID=A0A8J6BW83_9EUKA|nr:Ribosome maturation protein SBDS [Carpediemonas membranifera]|eukprot:KAG9392181.1 Ribosome maturation protein SBDS [Carpediemonas membranifera]
MNSQTVKYKAENNSVYEVLIKNATILEYRRGAKKASDILIVDDIFTNAQNGDLANVAELEAAFNTSNKAEMLEVILQKGHAPLTTAERAQVVKEKREQILGYIQRYFVSPVNGLPHPMTRIEAAVESTKCRFDHEKPTDVQRDAVLKKLQGILPLRKMEMEIELRIPTGKMGSVSGIIYSTGQVKNESWKGGEWEGTVTIVPGEYDSFIGKLQKVLKDDLDYNLPGFDMHAKEDDGTKGKAKGKGKGKNKGKR